VTATAAASAANVYVFSTGNANIDAAYVNTLTAQGHSPVIGAQWSAFDGTVDLSGYQAVFMNHGSNWGGSSQQVPVAGQQQLIDFVNAGGGLITTEWVIFNNGVSGGNAYSTLLPILPATYGGTWNSIASTTLTQITPDSVLNANLAASFTVPNVSYSGNETRLQAKPGATVFYQSSNMSSGSVVNAGVSGWQVGQGRVISFSTMPGIASMADANYAELMGNSVDWVIPAPSSLALLAAGGLVALRRKR
jgi:hypothetical protein